MNINQALKEKNRLAGKLAKLKQRIPDNARWIKGNQPDYDYKQLLIEYEKEVAKLVELKTKISAATQPVVNLIHTMAEKKGFIEVLKITETRRGRRSASAYSDTVVEYDSAITVADRDAKISALEDEIAGLQDKLDKFNATTEI